MPNKVVFITALPLEFQAVKSFLKDCQEKKHSRGTIYEQGWFNEWQVGLAETGQGNIHAAGETQKAIDFFDPDYIFFVGVAGGIKDVNLGDVVAATVMKGYERGKETDSGFLSRSEVGWSSHTLVERAKSTARNHDWLNKLNLNITDSKPKSFIGVVAAGEKLVTSENSITYERITKLYSDALAVEMEGIGFLIATHANEGRGIVIRGISDLLSNKEESDNSGWQEKAAHHAAAFAFAMLEKLIPTLEPKKTPSCSPDRFNAPISTKKIKAFANYEKERQALDTFITAEDCNKRIFLIRGNPGYGKSSLIEPYLDLDSLPSNIYLVHIQLRKGEHIYSVQDFILLVARSIGGAEKLPTFYEQLNNKERGEEYITNLTNSWFQDINTLNRQVVLIIDTYEDGIENIKNWINGCLLEYAATSSIIRVVIAGQEVPNPTITWGNFNEYFNLNGVIEVEHWLPVFVELERKIPVEHVSPIDHLRQICNTFQGRPHEIMQYIEGLPNEK